MYKITFEPGTNRLVSSISLEALSGREKGQLLLALLDQMGITERLAAGEEFSPAIALIEQRIEAHRGAQ